VNPALAKLQAYPFERLFALLRDHTPAPGQAHASGLSLIPLYIGEPRHAPPELVLEALRANLHQLGSYPLTRGLPVLREAVCAHLRSRALPPSAHIDPESMVLPVTGTREALFAFVQAATAVAAGGAAAPPLVVMPNPCYQIYEGAAIMAGCEPYYLNTTAATGQIPDLSVVPAAVWDRCQVLFLCTPGNPGGAFLSQAYLRHALELAERHDFLIASDECYADLYLDESAPPPSLLRAAWESGRTRYQRCLVFRSLSKRSSLPGLRSGFVAGDPEVMRPFLLYRTYHGCAMPVPTQLASAVAWSDEAHVTANRALYREKFARVVPLLRTHLDVSVPAGGFYLWFPIGGSGDDATWARALYAQQHVSVLPGSFIARDTPQGNPGHGRVRISLVATLEQCLEAAHRINRFMSAR